ASSALWLLDNNRRSRILGYTQGYKLLAELLEADSPEPRTIILTDHLGIRERARILQLYQQPVVMSEPTLLDRHLMRHIPQQRIPAVDRPGAIAGRYSLDCRPEPV